MPTENEYSLQDLTDATGVTPRTVRYYISQGLLPSPEGAGPGVRYSDGHVARLRLIRQLQRQHLPLAEIRARLAGLDDETISGLAEMPAPAEPTGSAVDYIRTLLGEPAHPAAALAAMAAPPPEVPAPPQATPLLRSSPGSSPSPSRPPPGPAPTVPNGSGSRSHPTSNSTFAGR